MSGFTHRERAWFFGRLIVGFVAQAQGAPLIDRASGRTDEGRHFDARCIHLRPWRRNEYGDRRAGRALMIGWLR